MTNIEKLQLAIVSASVATEFEQAKLEWILVRIYHGTGICACGKNPISKICIIKNKLNGNTEEVGSSCVQKFIGIPCQKLFVSFDVILKDEKAFLMQEFIIYLHENGVINDWEKDFLISTIGKKFEWLSEKQKLKRVDINRKVIKYMTRVDKLHNSEEREGAELTSGAGDLDPEWWK